MPKLILKRKAEVLMEYPLKGASFTYTIGSETGNDVVVPDKMVSMTHLQVERRGQQYFVRDLKSAFGTHVNGAKIDGVAEIRDGDVIEIGEHTIVFKNPLETDERTENKNSVVGKSISEFLNEVKHAVINSPDGAAITSPSNEETPPVAEVGAETAAPDSGSDDPFSRLTNETRARRASSQLGTDDLEREFSEIVNKPSEVEEQKPRFRTASQYEKSPYYLLAIYGPYWGKKYQLNFGETKIGRDSNLNDIVIRYNKEGEVDASISRRHATVIYRDGGFYLADKRSQSRTYLNQQKLSETDELRLMTGDEIEIVSDRQSTIFRFVAEGRWDFSPPKRAGQWWLRYRYYAVNYGTMAILILGLIVSIMAWRNLAIVTNVPNPFVVELKTFTKIETSGSNETSKVPRGPRYSSAEGIRPLGKSELPSLALAEINGDDNADVVVTQSSGVLVAVDGKNHRRLWEATNLVLNRVYPPVAADLNDNGMADLIALTADAHLVAIDGLYGAEIWMSPYFEKEMIGPPIVADFDGDEVRDVAVVSVEGKMQVGYSRVYDMEWVEINIGLPSQAPLSAGDLDGDGDDEILIGTERGIVLIYDGVERRLAASIDINEALNKLKGSFDEYNQIRHPIGLTDLNGDRNLDLIISTMQGNLLCMTVDHKTDQQNMVAHNLWWANLASDRHDTSEFSYPFVLGDLDKDGLADVVVVSDDGRIKAYRGRGAVGQRQPELWQTAPDTTGWVATPTICDFNKDGVLDIVVSDWKREVKILSGKGGELLWRDNEAIKSVTARPLLADLWGDTVLDIVMLSVDGVVYDFKTNRRVSEGSVIWGQLYGTPANTSTLAMSDPASSRYYFKLVISGLIMAATIAANVIVRQRRRRFAKS